MENFPLVINNIIKVWLLTRGSDAPGRIFAIFVMEALCDYMFSLYTKLPPEKGPALCCLEAKLLSLQSRPYMISLVGSPVDVSISFKEQILS